MNATAVLVSAIRNHLPPWMDDGKVKCKGLSSFMYPNQPSSEVAKAKALCNGYTWTDDEGEERVELPCPMRFMCLQHAIDNREPYGVWGGTSERDRRKIQRARKKFQNPHIYSLIDVRFPHIVLVQRKAVIVQRRQVDKVA